MSGAENVYPVEVENAIYGHPACRKSRSSVCRMKNGASRSMASSFPKSGVNADVADIIAFARTRIAAFKAPRSVEFVAALPKGPSGKILRRVLREPYWKDRRRVN